jgi:hypothetical protein
MKQTNQAVAPTTPVADMFDIKDKTIPEIWSISTHVFISMAGEFKPTILTTIVPKTETGYYDYY